MTNTPAKTPTPNTPVKPPEPTKPPEFEILSNKTFRPYAGLVYGPPGVGKTTLASSIPGSIVIDMERGSDSLGATRIEITENGGPHATIDRVKRACAYAVKQGFTTVILDSTTSLQALFENQFLIESQKTALNTGNYGADYEQITKKFKNFFGGPQATQGLMPFLSSKGCNLILLGHEKERTETIGDSRLVHTICPHLYTGIERWLSVQLDWIFYYCYDILVKEESLGMTKSKLSSTRGRKIITCQEGGITAKNRYGLPASISMPTGQLFVDMFDATKPQETTATEP
jgi:hypothetical protein